MRNGYPGSKYAHWDYNLLKDFKPYNTKNMKRSLLQGIGGVRYIQKSNTILLYKLIDYYKDLNKNFERILDNCFDEMFLRTLYWSRILVNEERFREYLLLWDDIFQEALEVYMKKHHTLYDESYKISYVSYFNMKFSACLTYAVVPVLMRYNNKTGYPEGYRLCRELEFEDFKLASQLEVNLPEYPSQSYHQELISQSFSPLEEAIV